MLTQRNALLAASLLALAGAPALAGQAMLASSQAAATHTLVVVHQQNAPVQSAGSFRSATGQRRSALPASASVTRVSRSDDAPKARASAQRASTQRTSTPRRVVIAGTNTAEGQRLARVAQQPERSSTQLQQDRKVTRRSSVAQRVSQQHATRVVSQSSLTMAQDRVVTNSSSQVRVGRSVTRSSTQIRETQTINRTSRTLRESKASPVRMRVAPAGTQLSKADGARARTRVVSSREAAVAVNSRGSTRQARQRKPAGKSRTASRTPASTTRRARTNG